MYGGLIATKRNKIVLCYHIPLVMSVKFEHAIAWIKLLTHIETYRFN